MNLELKSHHFNGHDFDSFWRNYKFQPFSGAKFSACATTVPLAAWPIGCSKWVHLHTTILFSHKKQYKHERVKLLSQLISFMRWDEMLRMWIYNRERSQKYNRILRDWHQTEWNRETTVISMRFDIRKMD
jgi:hypothetical protein